MNSDFYKLSVEHTIASSAFNKYEYPHEVLKNFNRYIIELGNSLSAELYNKISSDIWIANTAKIAPTAYISAPCIIDENAEIRHSAFIRGSVIVGKNAVVGNSSELKNCILFDEAQAPHYNYVGDSILGYHAHLGAGAVTSNLKMDKSNVTVDYGSGKFTTDLIKLGAILGDNVEIGCGAVLNPGTVIEASSRIYPLMSVRGFIPRNTIVKPKLSIEHIEIK